LLREYGIEVEFQETTTICVERLAGVGSAVEFKPTSRVGAPEFDKKINQFLATIGLRVEPGPLDSGIQFKLSGEASGNMPAAFYKAVEETVVETLSQGLYGWQVVDCIVTMTHAAYWPRQSSAHGVFDKNISSTARDFRYLTPLVLVDALREAGTMVCEPVHEFRLEVPVKSLDTTLSLLSQFDTVPAHTEQVNLSYVIQGDVSVKDVHGLQQQLPGATSGEGVLETSFKEYKPVRGQPPSRARTDNNPLSRREYLLGTLKKR
jgi:ribosomal protection tetracycline resistance protein